MDYLLTIFITLYVLDAKKRLPGTFLLHTPKPVFDRENDKKILGATCIYTFMSIIQNESLSQKAKCTKFH